MKPTSLGTALQAYKQLPPLARQDAIVRQALIERLVGVGAPPVAVLQGPAGSGKSTTLQQVHGALGAQQWATAWMVLDEADNDPQRFETQLHAMLACALHSDAATPLAPRGAGMGLAEWALGALAGTSRRTALFLDDFHALHEPALLQFFRDLLQRLPARARVFIGSRALPEVGLASLMVACRAAVLRAQDLRFSAQESQAFFARDDAPAMACDELERIYECTEGWPAGLQLFRLTLANPAVRDTLDELAAHGPRELAEYLSENVVSMQRPEVRDFLLRTSVLRRLSGPLCDAVLGRTGSHAILRQLEHDGLFLSALDTSGAWFRYHGLFAAHLRDGLARTAPGAAARLHALAARWHFAQGAIEEAVHHAIEARDMPLAVQALNGWSTQLVATAELVTAAHWYDRIATAAMEEVARQPDLMIKTAWALIFLRRRARLRPLLDMLEPLRGHGRIARTTDPSVVLSMAALFEDDLPGAAALLADLAELQAPAASGFAAFELGAATNLRAFHALGHADAEGAHHLLVLAQSHNARADAAFSAGYTLAVKGMARLLAAQPRQALRELSAASARRGRPTSAMASAALSASQIWAAYEVGALDEAERLAGQFGEQIAIGVVPDFIAVALLSLARAHAVRGRADAAQATLDTLDRIAFDSGWPRLVRMVEWERVRLALLDGQLDRARAIARRIAPAARPTPGGWLAMSELAGAQVLGPVRLALHAGELDGAARMLQAMEPLCTDRPLLLVKSLVLKALVLHQLGQGTASQRALLRALELAAPGECLRAFLDEGPSMRPLLEPVARSLAPLVAGGSDERMHAFARKVLLAAGIAPGQQPPPPAPGQGEPLSEREQRVLRLLCEGASNRDMAVHLAISENTVKFHLKNLYGKLGVGSRAQAIRAAQELQKR
ncbi:LuxR C-terminal-related transcriptional regulator [Xylophilus sp. ASV27]|uniref:LuxR C-terminal-related transcriptional regulator n=1 Tax=Xylophilus sp. ASV27 TaxID=2795129 RepID=UPI0018EA61B6|nr:LuxR C-terminal-related transcriptional regulator [Xylophilus sp. ASV27]